MALVTSAIKKNYQKIIIDERLLMVSKFQNLLRNDTNPFEHHLYVRDGKKL